MAVSDQHRSRDPEMRSWREGAGGPQGGQAGPLSSSKVSFALLYFSSKSHIIVPRIGGINM